MDEDRVARSRASEAKVRPHGARGLHETRCLHEAHSRRNRKDEANVGDAELGVAPTREERAHLVADAEGLHARPHGVDHARHLKTRPGGRALGGCVVTLALKDVRAVDPGGGDAYSYLPGAGNRNRALFDAKHLRTTKIGNSENYHRETPGSAVMDEYY